MLSNIFFFSKRRKKTSFLSFSTTRSFAWKFYLLRMFFLLLLVSTFLVPSASTYRQKERGFECWKQERVRQTLHGSTRGNVRPSHAMVGVYIALLLVANVRKSDWVRHRDPTARQIYHGEERRDVPFPYGSCVQLTEVCTCFPFALQTGSHRKEKKKVQFRSCKNKGGVDTI